MKKHNPDIQNEFEINMEGYEQFTEEDLVERLNPTILSVEKAENYSIKQRLQIFDLITQISNCSVRERKKFIKKLRKTL